MIDVDLPVVGGMGMGLGGNPMGKDSLLGASPLGGIFGQFFGGGHSAEQFQAPLPDRKHYLYGGEEGAAEQRANMYGTTAANMAMRGAPTADWSMANNDYEAQQAARMQQARALGQMQQQSTYLQNVMMGKAGPSLAEMQMRAGMNTAAANAQNLAASTRGGNTALAAMQAQKAMASGSAAAAQQAAMLRAQEQMQARDAYSRSLESFSSAAGQMRQGDFAARQGSQAQSQADLQNQQWNRDANDKMMSDFYDRADDIRKTQLQADMQFSGTAVDSGLQTNQTNAGIRTANAGASNQGQIDRLASSYGKVKGGTMGGQIPGGM